MNLYEEFKDKKIKVIVIGNIIDEKNARRYQGIIVNQKDNFITLETDKKTIHLNVNYIVSIEVY
ncbi:DUF6897 domain-containing protein [Fusobacterium ulcerans]|uniref:DUF6897 domain-containing protein n=1 Tax=Fusobacterium TaxID=848 RepID=UPI00241CE82C|nr:hypothetical protein [Fusobacterium ulcerans]